jgi:hypothetical protein
MNLETALKQVAAHYPESTDALPALSQAMEAFLGSVNLGYNCSQSRGGKPALCAWAAASQKDVSADGKEELSQEACVGYVFSNYNANRPISPIYLCLMASLQQKNVLQWAISLRSRAMNLLIDQPLDFSVPYLQRVNLNAKPESPAERLQHSIAVALEYDVQKLDNQALEKDLRLMVSLLRAVE